ncbi:protein monoglycylase TTLL8 isoform X13 [Rattus norvegicus]|uniref:protein monoglycylase TTLL8 isoform X13 n=1 Tax=Rattus norvegicus TaxID=10116 RepID=UPI002FD83DB1
MACSVQGLSPRPRPRPHPRPGPGRSLDRNTGLDLEPRFCVKASNSVRTASRVPSLRRCQRIPLSRSPPQSLPPVRPRSPTPRVGRRSARRKLRRQRHGSAQCIAQARPVALGNRKTPGRSGRRSAAAARAVGRVPAGAGGQRNQLREASMENGERKKLTSTLSDGDHKEENKLKQGIPQDLSSSPKLDRYKIARQLTEKAIKEKKIFSIYGHYPVIRATLRRKGWVEKKFNFFPKPLQNVEGEDKSAETKENQEIALERFDDIHDVMSRLVKNEIPYLLWTIKRDVVDYHSLTCDQMLNHYGKTASFTTKIGLCLNMRSLPWYVQANPNTFFPRCYGLCTESEKQEFLDDFRRTVAASILKWVVHHQNYCNRAKGKSKKEEAKNGDPSPKKDPDNPDLKLPSLSGQVVDTACKVCQAYLGQLEHEDIDLSDASAEALSEEEWNDLTQQYYLLVHGNASITDSRSYFAQCQALLSKISSVNPQTEIDGIRNIWIIKPAAKSRGRGLLPTEDSILRDALWTVQTCGSQ